MEKMIELEYGFDADWQVGSGEPSGFKSVTAFYPEEASGSNGIHRVSSWWIHLFIT